MTVDEDDKIIVCVFDHSLSGVALGSFQMTTITINDNDPSAPLEQDANYAATAPEAVHIYPNHARDVVKIFSPSRDYAVDLPAITAEMVLTASSSSLDVRTLSLDIYLLSVVFNDSVLYLILKA